MCTKRITSTTSLSQVISPSKEDRQGADEIRLLFQPSEKVRYCGVTPFKYPAFAHLETEQAEKFRDLYGGRLGSQTRQFVAHGQFGDDMFNYESSNMDSHTEDVGDIKSSSNKASRVMRKRK